ncbi:hypothetical protein F511_21662 [Dorcoceras hygrometricum]|uniref:Uncharacterized protein n=1 Tax=Dorcoceras hygrometricum TaxID=472368 RepID=A0A2Z7AZ91_9LAMI|nr:hypothetical protein F511_21662 [Dorcoceras hygrometricum]
MKISKPAYQNRAGSDQLRAEETNCADQIRRELRAEEVHCINKEHSSAKKKISLGASISLERISSGKISSGKKISLEQIKIRSHKLEQINTSNSSELYIEDETAQSCTKQIRAEQSYTK